MFNRTTFAAATLTLFSILFTSVVNAADTQTADIYKAVMQLNADIEQVRIAMGRPKAPDLDLHVLKAEPRHVFFAAQNSFRRANELAQQVAGVEWAPSLSAPEGEIVAADVMVVVQGIQQQVRIVMKALKIKEPTPSGSGDGRAYEPGAVLVSLNETSRQLSLLLGRTVEWSSVYDQTLQAVNYLARTLPADKRYPALPPFESDKSAPDVAARIIECREIARKPAAKHHVQMLLTDVNSAVVMPQMTEVDTYELMTLLLNDVAELTMSMPTQQVQAPPYPRPEFVLASNAYQLAGALCQQAKTLAKL